MEAGVGREAQGASITHMPSPQEIPVLALAYLGDAVYELFIRSYLLERGQIRAKDLHRSAVELVKAGAQAQILRSLEPWLTEEEKAMARRGRNAKSGPGPRRADIVEYRHATGLETLIGYWHLLGQKERMEQLLREALAAPNQAEDL